VSPHVVEDLVPAHEQQLDQGRVALEHETEVLPDLVVSGVVAGRPSVGPRLLVLVPVESGHVERGLDEDAHAVGVGGGVV
jgi:hypothetical protein